MDFAKLKVKLEGLKTVEEQMRLLKFEYTCLYLLINKFRGVEDVEFKEFCKSCDNLEEYELYVYYI